MKTVFHLTLDYCKKNTYFSQGLLFPIFNCYFPGLLFPRLVISKVGYFLGLSFTRFVIPKFCHSIGLSFHWFVIPNQIIVCCTQLLS